MNSGFPKLTPEPTHTNPNITIFSKKEEEIYIAVIITTLYFTMNIYIKQPIWYGLFTESLKHSYLEGKVYVLTVHCTERGKIVKNKLLFSGAGALKGGGGGLQ